MTTNDVHSSPKPTRFFWGVFFLAFFSFLPSFLPIFLIHPTNNGLSWSLTDSPVIPSLVRCCLGDFRMNIDVLVCGEYRALMRFTSVGGGSCWAGPSLRISKICNLWLPSKMSSWVTGSFSLPSRTNPRSLISPRYMSAVAQDNYFFFNSIFTNKT